MAGCQTFKGSWPWPWIGSYCIPLCITHRPLCTRQISLKSKKLFVDGHTNVRTVIRTYIRMDGRTFETGFIRSTLSKSRPKNEDINIIHKNEPYCYQNRIRTCCCQSPCCSPGRDKVPRRQLQAGYCRDIRPTRAVGWWSPGSCHCCSGRSVFSAWRSQCVAHSIHCTRSDHLAPSTSNITSSQLSPLAILAVTLDRQKS